MSTHAPQRVERATRALEISPWSEEGDLPRATDVGGNEPATLEHGIERLWSAQEVADCLGVPIRWVREATRDGRVPSVALGRYRRYRPSAIRVWIDANSVPETGTR